MKYIGITFICQTCERKKKVIRRKKTHGNNFLRMEQKKKKMKGKKRVKPTNGLETSVYKIFKYREKIGLITVFLISMKELRE